MDYTAMQREIFRLKRQFPNLQVIVFGRSLLGRALYALRVGEGQRKILFAGAFHGMEHMTARLLLQYLWEIGEAPLQCQLTVAPMINPDGVEIQQHGWKRAGRYAATVKGVSQGDTGRWQANARGVDLNHNFDAQWRDLRQREIEAGITGPAATRFGGYYPESEPESHALAQHCRREQFAMAVSFHTQGEEIYWDFGKQTPRQSYEMARAMAQASGYTVSAPEGLASGGGFKDWFITEFYRPAFTVEAGKGTNPLPDSDFAAIYEKLKPMLDRILER